MLKIRYEAEGFPGGTVSNGTNELVVTWDDILWAAVTAGCPNRYYVFRHGVFSGFEAIFRWSLIRMALEQSGSNVVRLRRTNVAKTLDPTEKGAVNYFIGMTFCKLFAAKLLNTPWLLHLDVFRAQLNAALLGRSRPDLVGREHQLAVRWHAFECKGRSIPPDSNTKSEAKMQAQRLVSVNGINCSLHIGAITYFKRDALNFYWRDPSSEERSTIKIPFTGDAWRYYYTPIMEMMRLGREAGMSDRPTLIRIDELDVEVGIHRSIAALLLNEQWEEAQQAAIEAATDIREAGYQPDGLLVKAGSSWSEGFTEQSTREE